MYIGKENIATSDFPVDRFSGTGAQTAFTLSEAPASVRAILVEIEGVVQDPESSYTLNGTTMTFSEAPPTGTNNIVVRFLGARLNVPTVGDNATITGGSISGADVTVGSGKTLDVSAGTLTLANDQISGDKIDGGTISNFASTGIDDNADATALTITSNEYLSISQHVHKSIDNSFLNIAGGNDFDTGGSISIYGSTHATLPNQVHLRTGGVSRIILDSAGNVSINGTVPSVHTNTKVIDFGSGDSQFAVYSSGSNYQTWMHNNVYYSSTGQWTFANNGPASSVQATNGQIELRVSNETGTAGNPLSVGWTTALGTNNTGVTTIKFAPTQVSSSDANTLDDYEEGTWTPVVYGQTTAGTGTYTSQVGHYTKIGNIVFYSLYVSVTAHNGTGTMNISLPFTSSGTALVGGFGVMSQNLTYTAGYNLSAYIYPGFAFLRFYKGDSNTAWSAVPVDSAFDVYTSGHFFI